MSKPKHTPGPWKAEQPWSGFTAIYGSDGKLIFGLAAGEAHERRSDDECSANLALIAAAPALVEALTAYRTAQRRMLERFSEGDERVKRDLWRDLHECEAAADAALKLAHGEADNV